MADIAAHGDQTSSATLDRAGTDPILQAFWLLRAGFAALPILVGLDKFAGVLTEWEGYLAPSVDRLVPGTAHQAMLAVGVTEIVAGVVVALRPRVGGLLVAAWLGGIIVNLLLLGDYYDVVLRDVGLLVGALSLARLAAGVGAPGLRRRH
jgi:hypothetical protein